jgi:methionyl-tRNA formyltransferase
LPTALLKIVYIGSSGPLSVIPLQTLLDSGQSLCAIASAEDNKPGLQDRRIPVMTGSQGSIASLARLHSIPVIKLSGLWSQSVDEIGKYSPDIIIVSCFARRLPDPVLSIPGIGCFNLHPSLLPAYRGPVPMFWQFRAGVKEFGITLHRMSSQLDAGNIVAQTTVTMPDGAPGQRASVLLAEVGSELLVQTLSNIRRTELTGSPQDERYASYQGFPSPSDDGVSVGWSAKRLYNFICATRERGVLYPCRLDARVYWLLEADSWQETGDSGVVINGNTITIPCSRGFVTARFQTD